MYDIMVEVKLIHIFVQPHQPHQITISQAHITDQFRMVYDFPPEQICN